MYEQRIQFALDNFISDDYFLSMAQEYCLKEEKESGKSELSVSLKEENLCIYDFDSKKKCNFLKTDKKFGMQKSVDHIIFQRMKGGWRLNLIEMKRSVGNETWISLKQKVRTSYLTAAAISVFLGIRITETYVYTTYEFDKFNQMTDTTNPKLYMPLLGKPAINYKVEEWDKKIINIKVDNIVTLPHQNIKMVRSDDGKILIGQLCL